MANINISDLRPAGADLFLDSESYLNDLTEGEMTNTLGGQFSAFACTSNTNTCNSIAWCNPKEKPPQLIKPSPKKPVPGS